ncbi:flagellar biosynthetic protein FliR [Jatrophihabitans telluris]|uniref:Flagellar biosynthetic protein FliR n=1 Tax=Jatrophihabitans telluris TaxID=2038343 RepID=A0ABY4QWX0_9ACTN|nr:flagellar biosynthetic protein FliR [Jatrophihabitans telluris]UQX87968.1 flagellar biosynthetic protein FliR [Jatrophihabitans telluris]
MNVQLSETALLTLLLCSLRITAWLMIAPPFAAAGIPKPVKFALSVVLSLAVMSAASKHVPAPEVGPLVQSAVEQLVIGSALGFLTRMAFSAIEAAGSLLDIFGGFSVAAAYDPLTTNTTSILGKYYGMLATTLIFASSAHLIILQGFLRTFTAMPLDGSIDLSKLGSAAVHGLGTMFVSALQIAGPLIAVLFIADLALGVLSRISPQLNVFQMSFPLKIMLTLGLVGLSFALLPQVVTDLANNTSQIIIGLGGGG